MTVQYLGGKSRLGKKIAAILNPMLVDGAFYYEPFCGACNVAQYIRAERRHLSDAHPQLIAMWKAVQAGWVPPDTVSEGEYRAAKRGELSPELTAFIGFGCSFGGKWFGGYARGDGGNYAALAKRSIAKKLTGLVGAEFYYGAYQTITPADKAVVYCDPPYGKTTAYAGVPEFDSAAFWSKVRVWSRRCCVVVSEYEAPEDFDCIAEISARLTMHPADGNKRTVERLFTHATRRNLQANPQV